MKKLTGSDIVTILRSSSKNAEVLKEAQQLTISDFNTDDPSVRLFLNLQVFLKAWQQLLKNYFYQ